MTLKLRIVGRWVIVEVFSAPVEADELDPDLLVEDDPLELLLDPPEPPPLDPLLPPPPLEDPLAVLVFLVIVLELDRLTDPLAAPDAFGVLEGWAEAAAPPELLPLPPVEEPACFGCPERVEPEPEAPPTVPIKASTWHLTVVFDALSIVPVSTT